MTVNKRMVIRILLFIARYINDDKAYSEELNRLATHINVEPFRGVNE